MSPLLCVRASRVVGAVGAVGAVVGVCDADAGAMSHQIAPNRVTSGRVCSLGLVGSYKLQTRQLAPTGQREL